MIRVDYQGEMWHGMAEYKIFQFFSLKHIRKEPEHGTAEMWNFKKWHPVVMFQFTTSKTNHSYHKWLQVFILEPPLCGIVGSIPDAKRHHILSSRCSLCVHHDPCGQKVCAWHNVCADEIFADEPVAISCSPVPANCLSLGRMPRLCNSVLAMIHFHQISQTAQSVLEHEKMHSFFNQHSLRFLSKMLWSLHAFLTCQIQLV